jgi:hypothetical protein
MWVGLALGSAVLGVGLLTPTPKQLIKAHLILEGRDLVTAENATATVDGVMQRVDKVVDKLCADNGVNMKEGE